MLSETFLVEQNLKWNPSWTKWYSHRRRFIGLLFANRYGWHHRFTLFIATPAHPINTWTIWNGGAIDERNASLTNSNKWTKACYLNSRFSLPRNAQSVFPTRKWWPTLNPEDGDIPKKRMKCHPKGLMCQCKCLGSISAAYS